MNATVCVRMRLYVFLCTCVKVLLEERVCISILLAFLTDQFLVCTCIRSIVIKFKFRIRPEIPHKKHKVTQTASWQKDRSCIGISNYKYRLTNTNYKRILGLGWMYRTGTVSDKCHWEFKPGLGAPNLTLIQSSSYTTYNIKKSFPSPTDLHQVMHYVEYTIYVSNIFIISGWYNAILIGVQC